MNHSHLRKATSVARKIISDCLTEKRYRIHADGQRYLNLKNIRLIHIIEDLIHDLAKYHIFELPSISNSPTTQIKYQYIITYTEPDVSIHIKFSPRDTEPPIVYLGFHSHNTGHAPLPQIPLIED